MPASESQVVLLTGGLGGARLAPSLRDALGPGRLTVVANVGDDLTWHGLRVCPDLDSVTYSLAGLWDSERGWGLEDETFRVRDALAGLQEPTWFNVGDRDLALHLLRTERLRAGRSLAQTTQELSRRLGVVDVEVIPASDEPSETRVLLEDGRLLHFQEWYVGERAKPELREVRLAWRGGFGGRRPGNKRSRPPRPRAEQPGHEHRRDPGSRRYRRGGAQRCPCASRSRPWW